MIGLSYLVESFSASYGFSRAAVVRILSVYGVRGARLYFEAIRSPGSHYYLRVNTVKASREEVIKLLREEGFKAFPSRILEDAIFLRIRGPYAIKPRGKKVYADKAASESVYMGANLYAPGVKKAPKVKEGDIVTIYSPNLKPVAVGIAEMDGDEMETSRRGLAVRVTESVYRVPSVLETEAHKRGLVYAQSLPSMLSVKALNPQPGEVVLDMCAAPGGKATYAGQLMLNEGVVFAIDRTESKVSQIARNAERLGLKNIKPLVADSRYIDKVDIPEKPDAIIIDPPCSALGVRPKLYYSKSFAELEALPLYQRQFFKAASRVIKRGGRILYSTCTVTYSENEENVYWATSKLGLKVRMHKPFYGEAVKLGSGYVQRFNPYIHNQPGFFISILMR